MEKMVSDTTIHRVIIVSDSLYAEKADGRRGGVGTETQIISKEVYDSVIQTKFVPVVRERDDDLKACLPVYLQNRKYIDMSEEDMFADAYDQLLRNIFDRPLRKKPEIGKPPAHLFNDDTSLIVASAKATRFCDVVTSGKGSASAAFDDFADAFITDFEQLRMVYARSESSTWCEQIRANISSAVVHRDVFVKAVRMGAANLPLERFVGQLIDLLERVAGFRERPDGNGSFFECSEDNYKLLCYELNGTS